MLKHIVILLFLILCSFDLNCAWAKPAASIATPASTSTSINPEKVWVETYLFDVDDFNLMKGSYEMIFYMGFRCVPNCDNLHFEIINGKKEQQEVYESKRDYKYYRVTARLSQDLNFHRYPFEKHNLHIVVEDKSLDNNKLIFLPDVAHSGINNGINLVGWSEEPVWSATVQNYTYPNYNTTHSRYIFNVQIARPILAGILKNIVPGVFIMLVGFLTLFLDESKAVNGLAISSGALISMILLHLANISSIPENDYMTYLDSFMIINYFGLLLLLAELIALINIARLHPAHHNRLKIIGQCTPLLWLLLQIINSLIFFA